MLGEDDDDGDLFGLERQASEAERRGPRVEVPRVADPADSLPDPSTVDPAVRRSFLTAVIYANVALLGVSLGLMLIGFRGDLRWGGAAVGVGVLAGIRVYQTYRAFRNRDRDDATPDDATPDGDDGAADTTDATDTAEAGASTTED
ncbi:DUF7322 domain-containing protein [Halobaculum litoreum]|uniref:DUF7322 domain-containing protein n=1 Tax=Halobaculum litoreum TaxID=3031998 RepID=A0ABD5XP80_9EURY|nr:hypothetical protein [Halobaculum sp. DT92]